MKGAALRRWRLDRGPLWVGAATALLLANLIVGGRLLVDQWNERPRIPTVSRYRPDLSEFRRLTANSTGPAALHRLKIAEADGDGPRLSINSFQLIYGSPRYRSTIVIDTGLDQRLHREFAGGGRFYPEAYARLQRELLRTRAVYWTRESYDHVGGVSRSADLYGIRDRLHFTKAQARSPKLTEGRFPPTVLEAMNTIACDVVCSPAPGLALFAVPGDAPGAQWIFISAANGREYMLVGDQTIRHAQIADLQAHSRVWYWRENRDADDIAHRLRALHDLQIAAPNLAIIPVHDENRIAQLIATGWIGDGFDYDSPFAVR
ncbi:MAG: hypothetical protein RIF32_23025 [Leptospirales bacterium]|jgi:glyoxylase-like metal-dependent hydrolase (beta-lactamase superfamily II)